MQLGFLPGNLCITQLLSIINEIQTGFDNSSTVDVRDVFLDISETFDIVWHSVVLFNLQAYGFEIELIALLKDYLDNRGQRVVLNDQTSE